MTRQRPRPLTGYPLFWDIPYHHPRFERVEVIRTGALSSWLAHPEPLCALVDHDHGRCLARTADGSMTVRADDLGLLVRADVSGPDAGSILDAADRGWLSMSWDRHELLAGVEPWHGLSVYFCHAASPVEVTFTQRPANMATSCWLLRADEQPVPLDALLDELEKVAEDRLLALAPTRDRLAELVNIRGRRAMARLRSLSLAG